MRWDWPSLELLTACQEENHLLLDPRKVKPRIRGNYGMLDVSHSHVSPPLPRMIFLVFTTCEPKPATEPHIQDFRQIPFTHAAEHSTLYQKRRKQWGEWYGRRLPPNTTRYKWYKRGANYQAFSPVLWNSSATGNFLWLPHLFPSSCHVPFSSLLLSFASPLLPPLISSSLLFLFVFFPGGSIFIPYKCHLFKTRMSRQEEFDVNASSSHGSSGTCDSFLRVFWHHPDHVFVPPLSPGQMPPLRWPVNPCQLGLTLTQHCWGWLWYSLRPRL